MKPQKKLSITHDEVVQRIVNGETQVSLAREFGVSRERIRQIYKQKSSTPYKVIHAQRLLERQEVINQKKEKLVEFQKRRFKFNCKTCNTNVSLYDAHGRTTYCSQKCADSYNRRAKNPMLCDMCEKLYYGYKTAKYGKYINNFCGMKCYDRFRHLLASSYLAQRSEKYRQRIQHLKEQRDQWRNAYRQLIASQKTVVVNKEPDVVKLVVNSGKPQMRKGDDTRCSKCSMILTGEYFDYRSQKDRTLCRECGGDFIEREQESSLMNSGVIKA